METGVLMRYGFDGPRQGRWKVRELENAWSARTGAAYTHCCSSGTAAVWAALICAGVGAGDEVILPPFTFVADVEAVLYAGAIPVFADIDATLTLDPAAVEAAITPRTKAVLLVHMCGSMGRVDLLAALCQRHGILLIEDVAQAAGGSYQGRALGRFGALGCFSFDYVKTLTCGEGGAIITDDERLYRLVDAFCDHGHDHLGKDRGADLHPVLGLNFRLSELHAAVGLAQLGKLDLMLARQRRARDLLMAALAGLPGLTFREIPDPAGDTATFLSFFLPTEDLARAASRALPAAGLDGCFYWYDNNWHYLRKWDHFRALASPSRLPQATLPETPAFTRQALPASDALMSRTLSLLLKLSWSEETILARGATLRRVLAELLA